MPRYGWGEESRAQSWHTDRGRREAARRIAIFGMQAGVVVVSWRIECAGVVANEVIGYLLRTGDSLRKDAWINEWID